MALSKTVILIIGSALIVSSVVCGPLRRQDDEKYASAIGGAAAVARKSEQDYSVKKYDQRQDGDLNIQAHLDKIVLLIIPSKQINFLDYSIKGQFENFEDLASLLAKEQPLNEVKFKQNLDEVKIVPLKDKDIGLAAQQHKDKEKESIGFSKESQSAGATGSKDSLKQVKDTSLRDRIEPKISPSPKSDQQKSGSSSSSSSLTTADSSKADSKKPNEIPVLVQSAAAKRVEADIIKITTLPDTLASLAAVTASQRKASQKSSEGRTYQVVQTNQSGDKFVAVSTAAISGDLTVGKENSSSNEKDQSRTSSSTPRSRLASTNTSR